MKLKEFNAANIQSNKPASTTPFIQVNTKTGLFNINRAACEVVGVKNNDQLQFLQDEENPEEWFVEKVKKDGFVIREKEAIGKGNLFNSTALARLIFKSVNCEYYSGRILIGEQVKELKGRNVFRLVTSSINAYRGEE